MYWSNEGFHTIPPAAAPAARHVGLILAEFGTGGSERIAIRMANRWAATRRVTIFAGDDDGPVRSLVDDRIAVVRGLPSGRGAEPSARRIGRALAPLIAAAAVDVLVAPGNSHAPILRAILDRLPGPLPASLCKLSNPLHRDGRSRIGQAIFARRFRATTRPFDRLVAMAPVLADEAAAVTGRARIDCVAEPVLDDQRGPIGQRGPGGTILLVGRLVRQKNVALALDTLARLPATTRLIVLGEGEDYGALCERVTALGLNDRVRFAGFVGDVRPYMAAADALLCTSRYEGFPAALVEAIAAGLPVVTTDCSPALPDIMLDESFGAVRAADPALLAEALAGILADGTRPAEAPRRLLARRHQLGASAHAWLALLDAAVAARATARIAPPVRIGDGPRPAVAM